jgi:hypothetical protein
VRALAPLWLDDISVEFRALAAQSRKDGEA